MYNITISIWWNASLSLLHEISVQYFYLNSLYTKYMFQILRWDELALEHIILSILSLILVFSFKINLFCQILENFYNDLYTDQYWQALVTEFENKVCAFV